MSAPSDRYWLISVDELNPIIPQSRTLRGRGHGDHDVERRRGVTGRQIGALRKRVPTGGIAR